MNGMSEDGMLVISTANFFKKELKNKKNNKLEQETDTGESGIRSADNISVIELEEEYLTAKAMTYLQMKHLFKASKTEGTEYEEFEEVRICFFSAFRNLCVQHFDFSKTTAAKYIRRKRFKKRARRVCSCLTICGISLVW